MRRLVSGGRGALALLGVGLVLGLAVLAAAEVTVSPSARLRFQVGERLLDVTLSPESFSGGGLALQRIPGGLRGHLEGRPVTLEWREGLITGEVAGEPVRLQVRPRAGEQGLELEGLFTGEQSRLTLSAVGVVGTMGGCDYRLPWAGERYSGWRACEVTRGPPIFVVLELPEGWTSLGMEEEAALLALLLSAEAIPPAPSPMEVPGRPAPGSPSP